MLYCTVSVDGMGWLLIYLGTTTLPLFDAVQHGECRWNGMVINLPRKISNNKSHTVLLFRDIVQ